MKHTKRYLSVALAIMLFVSMFAGMASALDAAPTIIKLTKLDFWTTEATLSLSDPIISEDYDGTRYFNVYNLNGYATLTPEWEKPTYTTGAQYKGEEEVWSISDPSIVTLGKATGYYTSTGLWDDTDTYYLATGYWRNPRLALTGKTGTFTLTVANQDGTVKGQLKVTIKEAESTVVKNPVKEIVFTHSQDEYTVKTNSNLLNDLSKYVQYVYEKPDDPEEPISVSWSSDDKSVATVNENGYVTGKKIGSANITVTVKNLNSKTKVSKTIKVNVIDNPVTKISFDPMEYTMEMGASENIWGTRIIEPEDVNTDSEYLTLLSSDPSVVKVTGHTSFKAVGPGEATVTAMYYNEVAKAYVTSEPIKVKVTEVPVTEMKFAVESINLATGSDGVDLKNFVTMTPDEGASSYTKDAIQWSSSDKTVAYMNGSKVWPAGVGEATITAKIYNKVAKTTVKATVKVKVVEATTPVEAVTFTQESFKMIAGGENLELGNYVQIDPKNHEKTIETYTTSDYAVAAVNKTTGVVVARGVGEATITLSVYNTVSKTTIEATTKVVVEAAKPATAIEAKPAKFVLAKGDDLLWTAGNYLVVTPADANDYYGVTLTSADDDIVGVKYDEYYGGWDIIANQVGTVDVTATLYNRTEKTYLTTTFTVEVVDEIPLKGISFKKDSYVVKLDSTPYRNIGNQVKTDPINASMDGYTQIWESSDMEVATVANGTVTAKNVGSATITLTLLDETGAKVASASTTVKTEVVPVTKVSFNMKQVRLYFAATANEDYNTCKTLSLNYQPSNAYVKRVDWDTTDAAVAVVGELYHSKGSESSSYSTQVVATGVGTCTVTAKLITLDESGNEVEIVQKIEVLVSSKTVDLKLNATKKTLNLKKGEDVFFQMEAIDDTTGDPVPVRWKSSNAKVAKIDSNGLVIALKAGKATITATTKDGNKTTANCVITVKKLKITKITAEKKLTLKVGETYVPAIKIKPAGAYITALKFSSSDASIVKVDADGTLTALAAGKATITISATDGSKKSCKIKVTVK